MVICKFRLSRKDAMSTFHSPLPLPSQLQLQLRLWATPTTANRLESLPRQKSGVATASRTMTIISLRFVDQVVFETDQLCFASTYSTVLVAVEEGIAAKQMNAIVSSAGTWFAERETNPKTRCRKPVIYVQCHMQISRHE